MRRRRQAGRPAASSARRLGLSGHARDAQHLHLGPRRLALRLSRRLHAFAGRQARHAGQRTRRRSTPASGAIIRRGTSSKSSRTAPAIRGASISTSTARRSSKRASSRTASTSSRAAATSGRPATISTRTPTPTFRPSPITATIVGATAARRQQSLRHRRRRPRPLRPDVLPGRHLARGISRPALHGQYPRPPHQHGYPRSRKAPATSPRMATIFCSPTTPGPASST